MTDLQRLARSADISFGKLLRRTFVVGSPGQVSTELQATAIIEDMILSRGVERAQALMAQLGTPLNFNCRCQKKKRLAGTCSSHNGSAA